MIGAAWCRAIALDYDGTLTAGARPTPAVLDALASWRRDGGRIVLVTGRTVAHLLTEFDDVANSVDLVVAENGAVLWDGTRTRLLAHPVEEALGNVLGLRGVPCRRGSVIYASRRDHALEIEAAIDDLRLDVQLVPNRSELMLLPAGTSKGTGVRTALRSLGLSPHSAIAIGDGENDLSLLQSCEVGVAVANAVPILRNAADVVTSGADAAGVVEVLSGEVAEDRMGAVSNRWKVEIGSDSSGGTVSIPASRVDVLVCGKSGGGKSYVAGLIAERLIELDYSLFIIDPEGDHNSLARLPDVVAVGSGATLPSVEHLATILRQNRGTVSVDLSLQTDATRDEFYDRVPAVLERLWVDRGLPHWIVLDEAHASLRRDGQPERLFDTNRKGHLLVTFDPTRLPDHVIDRLDVAVIIPGADNVEPVLSSFGCDRAHFGSAARGAGVGDAVILRRTASSGPTVERVTVSTRRTGHVRHLHKYAEGQLAEGRRFYFRNSRDQLVGVPAGNLEEFHSQILACEPDVIEHHALAHDFSRWIRDVLLDEEAASAVEAAERQVALDTPAAPAVGRAQILAAVERRYGALSAARPPSRQRT